MKKQLVLVFTALLLQGMVFGVADFTEREGQLDLALNKLNHEAGALWERPSKGAIALNISPDAGPLYQGLIASSGLSESEARSYKIRLGVGSWSKLDENTYELSDEDFSRYKEIRASLQQKKEEFVTQILPRHQLPYREVSLQEDKRNEVEYKDAAAHRKTELLLWHMMRTIQRTEELLARMEFRYI